jgi:hypothetical protein
MYVVYRVIQTGIHQKLTIKIVALAGVRAVFVVETHIGARI